MQRGRERRLRQLFRLLRTFVAAEKDAREDGRIAVQKAANELKAAEIAARKVDYRLRYAKSALGVRQLLEANDKLRKENIELKATLNSGAMPTLTESAGDCAC